MQTLPDGSSTDGPIGSPSQPPGLALSDPLRAGVRPRLGVSPVGAQRAAG